MKRFLLAIGCVVAVAGCGSSTTTGTGGANSSQAAPSSSGGGGSTSAPASSSLGNLVISGSLSLTVAETSTSANKCQAAPGSDVTANLGFDAYVLQMALNKGTTTFPATAASTNKGLIAFYNSNDSTQEWSIGSRVSASAAGTATISADGKTGTVDVDMIPDTPRPNPALKPIHVKGTFTCQ